tara:strand:- start:2141 stop:2833 length:693 start_codon:yes stop_codon:yes gene_type:complete
MKNICVITARGGSKRIPRKNIKDFLGKPIIAYSIELAIESRLFEEVMVSTDDEEIANVAKSFGAKVPFLRSAENANDYAGTFEVLKEVMGRYKKIGQSFNYLCCLYPTAPFVQKETLQRTYDLLKKRCYHTVFPVCKYSTPIQRALKIVNDRIEMFSPENRYKRSQDLEQAYYDVGQFYWLDVSKMDKEGQLYSSKSGFVVLDEKLVQDIDTPEDWEFAELKYKLINEFS